MTAGVENQYQNVQKVKKQLCVVVVAAGFVVVVAFIRDNKNLHFSGSFYEGQCYAKSSVVPQRPSRLRD